MANKIRRNAPCPCGSGKKYKKCCLRTKDSEPFTTLPIPEKPLKTESTDGLKSNTLEYFETHESSHILNVLIGLQLVPENHGKNFRIEELCTLLVQNLNSLKPGNFNLLNKYLHKEYNSSIYEDYPENLFCENTAFAQGTYPLFSGISTHSPEIFNNFIKVIFLQVNSLPEEFKGRIFHGITLLLELGKYYADKVGIGENIIGTKEDSKLRFLQENIDFSLSKDKLAQICKDKSIHPSIITEFIISVSDNSFDEDDPNLNPLLEYPIVQFDDKYYYLLVSNQANTINEFILRTAKNFDCETVLLQIFHENLWRDIWRASENMRWSLLDIKIPEIDEYGFFLKEGFFQFDNNRLAYIALNTDSTINSIKDNKLNESAQDGNLGDRASSVISKLKKQQDFEDYKFLTISLYTSIGRDIVMTIEDSSEEVYSLAFSTYSFLDLAFSGEWNSLSLYKFAKVLHHYKDTVFLTNDLDIYHFYKNHDQSFYLNDKRRPNVIDVIPGIGTKLIKEIKLSRDLHSAKRYIGGQELFAPVIRCSEHMPLYELLVHPGLFIKVLESFSFPIWFTCKQVKNDSMANIVNNYIEAIGFWLNKLIPAIKDVLEKEVQIPLEFELILDDEVFSNEAIKNSADSNELPTYDFLTDENRIIFRIPNALSKDLRTSTNEGERGLMKSVLSSFNLIEGVDFDEEFINTAINRYIPLGHAKMILFIDSSNDFMIDGRWKWPALYISSAEINLILDELPSMIDSKVDLSKEIESREEKIKVFNTIVNELFIRLEAEIQVFSFDELLNSLVNIHEALVWQREHNKTIIPAQLICFGDNGDKADKILKDEKELARTSLAVRCLIEYIASTGTTGNVIASYDDIDRLLAFMYQIISFGSLSDSVYFKMNNPRIRLLVSGRIGISKDFNDNFLEPFSVAYINEVIDGYLDDFDSRFDSAFSKKSTKNKEGENEEHNELSLINKAFADDWGLTLSTLYTFCRASACIAIDAETSVLSIEESEFTKKIASMTELSNAEINICINKFSLESRPDYFKAPERYKNSEVFPWKYNREFSFARRFIIKHQNEKEEYLLTWGFRNAISSSKQLHQLLLEGRLKNGGPKIGQLLGRYRKKNGKKFRNKVKDWFNNRDNLLVIDHEVDISPKGHLKSDSNYGDIDILVYDRIKNQVLSIECKATNKAKNIHEMKNEMDNYLGRNKGKGLVMKHLERHKWLSANKKSLEKYLSINSDFKVKSVILTSEVIPTTYIKADALPSPIISFPELRREGLRIFDNIK